MNMNQFLKYHPSLVYADDMQQAIKPLSQLGITDFAHVRTDQTGSITGNASHPEFFENYFREGFCSCDYSIDNQDELVLRQQQIELFMRDMGDNANAVSRYKFQHACNVEVTRRERQCAALLLDGKSSREIAEALSISNRTVEVYFKRLKKRFGSKNKIQLVKHILEADIF